MAKVNRTRLWTDRISVGDDGLYRWEIFQGTISKKSGFAFSPDEAQEEITIAREALGVK